MWEQIEYDRLLLWANANSLLSNKIIIKLIIKWEKCKQTNNTTVTKVNYIYWIIWI